MGKGDLLPKAKRPVCLVSIETQANSTHTLLYLVIGDHIAPFEISTPHSIL